MYGEKRTQSSKNFEKSSQATTISNNHSPQPEHQKRAQDVARIKCRQVVEPELATINCRIDRQGEKQGPEPQPARLNPWAIGGAPEIVNKEQHQRHEDANEVQPEKPIDVQVNGED